MRKFILIWGGGNTIELIHLANALDVARAIRALHPDEMVAITSTEAEGGYGDDGRRTHDGLTDDEREIVREAGF